MAQAVSTRDWHWPHLLLLALLFPASLLSAAHTPEVLLGLWIALNLGVLALAERTRPFRAEWRPRPAELVRDGSVFALNSIVDSATKAGIAVIAIHFSAPSATSVPLPLQLVLGAVIAELGSYAMHRWSHRGGWLWRVHAFHHRPEAVNVGNALTAHPLNALYDGVVRAVPLALLGFAPSVILALAMFHLTQALVAHANVRGQIGLLRLLLGNAEMHRLHHSTREGEAGNFGTDLVLWDRVFGTFRSGTAPETVGVFNAAGYPAETATRQWLAWPFFYAKTPVTRVHSGDGDSQRSTPTI